MQPGRKYHFKWVDSDGNSWESTSQYIGLGFGGYTFNGRPAFGTWSLDKTFNRLTEVTEVPHTTVSKVAKRIA